MIRFTKPDGKPFYVNAKSISATTLKCSGETRIYVGSTIDDCFIVTESPEEVVRKIMEYKLADIDYRVLGGEESAKRDLYRLAGLEDTPDAK